MTSRSWQRQHILTTFPPKAANVYLENFTHKMENRKIIFLTIMNLECKSCDLLCYNHQWSVIKCRKIAFCMLQCVYIFHLNAFLWLKQAQIFLYQFPSDTDNMAKTMNYKNYTLSIQKYSEYLPVATSIYTDCVHTAQEDVICLTWIID